MWWYRAAMACQVRVAANSRPPAASCCHRESSSSSPWSLPASAPASSGVASSPLPGPATISARAGRSLATTGRPAAIASIGFSGVTVRQTRVSRRGTTKTSRARCHRAASARDGAALARFLRWAETALPAGGETELSAAAKLQAFREATGVWLDSSFETISATGAHGASPHYKVTEESNAPIEPGQLYLVDSGGQYRDGTTDVTRVIPVGTPSEEMCDRFTRVLKGHIALATAIFPPGTNGGQLDAFARRPLWEAGLDYAHGTGHGVGAYLSVHEGPQRIAQPFYPGGGPSEPLRAGMILSNEPGYYKAGEYGIRIENLILVEPREIVGGEQAMLGFETLTFCPIERALIVAEMLSPAERAWLDAYHARVVAVLAPQMDEAERAWLAAKCAPIG